jgi:hypothetical protein
VVAVNRKDRRAQQKVEERELTERIKQLPDTLQPVPRNEWPSIVLVFNHSPRQMWASKTYIVLLFDEAHGVQRLSINRTTRRNGQWRDNITWGELQDIKRDVGFGGWYAVEVYPRDIDIVNVANMRHLWLLPVPLQVGWVNDGEDGS